MKHIGKKVLSIVLTLVMILSVVSISASEVKAEETVGSSWTVNPDGTLSVSEATANKAVGSLTHGNMILIGTKGGTIESGSLPASNDTIITKISDKKDAAMIRYTSEQNKDIIIAAIKAVKFTSATTQVHIDVTLGGTSNSMNDVTNFGVLNADGEAHVYKLIEKDYNISWLQAFVDTVVNATDQLGGLKGYLATVTTTEEADLVRGYYNSSHASSDAGTWIAGTSLKYSTDNDTTYASAGKISPKNYSAPSSTSVSDKKISAMSGAYYCPYGTDKVSADSYYDDYYWACGPEQGQSISTSLWANGEPNNSDSSRGGETCIVSPWSGKSEFNDFSPFNSVKAYFLEFSAYKDGLVNGASYNSITIYKVTLNNGDSDSINPMEKIKGEDLILRTSEGLTAPTDKTWFAGWYATDAETDYTRIATYSTDEPATLYAHWSQFGYTTQYNPIAATGLTYNGKQQLLIDTDGGRGKWRVNAPTDGNSNSYTYWYSKAETSGYVEGTVFDNTITANEGYTAELKTDCTPLYETNAGTYNVYWNWNYQAGGEKLGMLTVTIDQKSINDPTINLVSDAESFTYDGSSHAPTITITDNGTALTLETDYSVKYKGTGTTNYEESSDAPVNVGTYKAIITGTGNYKDTIDIDFTINKAKVSAPTIASKQYTGKTLTADVEKNSLYSVTVNDGGVDVGDYDVVLTLSDPNNYKWSDSDEKTKTLTFQIIHAKPNKVTVSMDDWTYGDEANKPAVKADFGPDKVVYSYSPSQDGTYTDKVPTEAGIWYIKASIPATDNYAAGEAINHFAINKKALTVTADSKEISYGAKDVELTYKVTGLANGDTADKVLTGAIEREAGTDAGTYKITQGTLKANDNYTIVFTGADYVIKKITYTAPVEEVTALQTLSSNKADGKISGLDKNKSYQYSTDGGKTWIDIPAGTDSIDVPAGTYQIRYVADKNHDAGETVTVYVKNTDINTLAINAGFKVTQKGSKITIKWGKVDAAEGYEVYVQYCGKNFSKTPAKRTTTKTSAVVTKIGGKKINLKKNFKVYVVAVKKDGDKNIQIAKSMTGHIVGRKNTKYTNVKSINLTTKTISVAVGKTSKIKAKTVLVNKKKKQLSDAHASEFRYASSDESIATVDKSGKVTGVSAGTCTVYVYARNGYAKTVSVTVK